MKTRLILGMLVASFGVSAQITDKEFIESVNNSNVAAQLEQVAAGWQALKEKQAENGQKGGRGEQASL